MKVAIVGATGLVGRTMLRVLEERKFPLDEIWPVASVRSLGKSVPFGGQSKRIISIEEAIKNRPDLVLFSAGGGVSRAFAQKFASVGATVIDNSSTWRMEKDVPLIVPEVNASTLTKDDKIIANPNCSTIQLVVALDELHKKFKVDRMVISTYQSVSGTGMDAIRQLEEERKKGVSQNRIYPYVIHNNLFPHGGEFLDNGYTTEEMKLVHETRKIMGDETIQVSATVVRVPVTGGHSESVNVHFANDVNLHQVRQTLHETAGVTIVDDPDSNLYPMPVMAEGKDDVFVGRIRQDLSQPNTFDLWIVSDNLRKGAATNAVQIAEYLVDKDLL